MNASSKFVGFTIALAAVFGLAFGAGDAFSPEGAAPPDTHDTSTHDAAPASTAGVPAASEPMPAGHGHGHTITSREEQR
ncbi:hypothetical protein CH286_25770 [Rhodococcus sp. WWJCD1]|uniref:hypothetical protein n=1 Tax=unclassified Rhodococcus (in: high G+C Gram-positive bacteria) TaxID=192944 RepID=UPI000B9B6A36|nr:MULTISPECIES: hypothetical protein [unclassified Rhodococcus (in: high G+C Gram-positive bacteria)]OZC42558.1 hypothetical protein CH286_25770 [Rhodococcus sp. WWJCD1]OZE89365.1 hypothetical protein CH302_28795 [Rhodococcus sp. 15-2388-1-1a]